MLNTFTTRCATILITFCVVLQLAGTGNRVAEGAALPLMMNVQPPAYLSVTDYEKCVSDSPAGRSRTGTESFKIVCLPQLRPENCPEDSFAELSSQNLKLCS